MNVGLSTKDKAQLWVEGTGVYLELNDLASIKNTKEIRQKMSDVAASNRKLDSELEFKDIYKMRRESKSYSDGVNPIPASSCAVYMRIMSKANQ